MAAAAKPKQTKVKAAQRRRNATNKSKPVVASVLALIDVNNARYAKCDSQLQKLAKRQIGKKLSRRLERKLNHQGSDRTVRRWYMRKHRNIVANEKKLATTKDAAKARAQNQKHVHRVVECQCCGTRRQRDDHACDNLMLLALYMLAFGFDARPAHLPAFETKKK